MCLREIIESIVNGQLSIVRGRWSVAFAAGEDSCAELVGLEEADGQDDDGFDDEVDEHKPDKGGHELTLAHGGKITSGT